MPEFLERRYNSASRAYFTWVSIVAYVLTKISVTLFAGGIVMRAVTGLDFWTSAVILIVITGLYTVFGGLRAVIYTEVMQTLVLSRLGYADVACGLSASWLIGSGASARNIFDVEPSVTHSHGLSDIGAPYSASGMVYRQYTERVLAARN